MDNTLNTSILNYNGSNGFMNSLRAQLALKGTLSPRQMECAAQFFGVKPKQTDEVAHSLKVDDRITVRKWLANQLGKQLGLRIFFRNLIVHEVISETAKAVLVKVTFDSKIATCCHICGLNLDNEISKATGIGPVCAKRLGFQRVTMSDAPAILAKIEEEAKIAGIVGPIWIPKSQLVSKAEQILFEKD